MAVAIERVLDRVDNSGMPVAEIAADGLAREVEHPRSVAERELHALCRDHVHEAVLLGRDVLVQVVASIPRLEEVGRRGLGGFAHVHSFPPAGGRRGTFLDRPEAGTDYQVRLYSPPARGHQPSS